MTAKQSETMTWVLRGVTTLAWCACATIYASVNSRLSRIEERIEIFKSVQDIDHTDFRVTLTINNSRIQILENRVRGLEVNNSNNDTN